MKKLMFTVLAVLVTASTGVANEQPVQKEVQIGLSGVFVPGGFDSNSDTYVVASGVFPNGCYRWSRSETVARDTFTHEINSKAIVTQGMCIMVLVPFQKDIRLGKLVAGKHTLRFMNGDGTYFEKSVQIEE